MRVRILSFVLLALVLLLASCAGQSGDTPAVSETATVPKAQYRKISPQEAKAMMADENIIIVDVRTPGEYEQGYIPGAALIPNETISTVSKPQALEDTNAVILVYCRSGSRSAQAARKLVSLGYTQVYDFGGIIDWPYDIVK
jgi:phage shock protein E